MIPIPAELTFRSRNISTEKDRYSIIVIAHTHLEKSFKIQEAKTDRIERGNRLIMKYGWRF